MQECSLISFRSFISTPHETPCPAAQGTVLCVVCFLLFQIPKRTAALPGMLMRVKRKRLKRFQTNTENRPLCSPSAVVCLLYTQFLEKNHSTYSRFPLDVLFAGCVLLTRGPPYIAHNIRLTTNCSNSNSIELEYSNCIIIWEDKRIPQ